jgi:hypothetical protein
LFSFAIVLPACHLPIKEHHYNLTYKDKPLLLYRITPLAKTPLVAGNALEARLHAGATIELNNDEGNVVIEAVRACVIGLSGARAAGFSVPAPRALARSCSTTWPDCTLPALCLHSACL